MMELCKNDREYWMLGNVVKYRGILACKSVRHHLANMDDTFYSEILSSYTASEYKYPAYIYNIPLNQRPDVKSKFRQNVKPYKVEDGIVMHGKEQVLTKRNLHGVLKAYHDNPVFGGHFGRDKTYKKISQQYYWKGMLTFSVLLISMFLIIGAGWGSVAAMRSWREESQSRQSFNVCSLVSLLPITVTAKSIQNVGVYLQPGGICPRINYYILLLLQFSIYMVQENRLLHIIPSLLMYWKS